jgi:hypothetical protein
MPIFTGRLLAILAISSQQSIVSPRACANINCAVRPIGGKLSA